MEIRAEIKKILDSGENPLDELVELFKSQEISLEQAVLFHLLQPLLQIQGTQEFTEKGIQEFINKEVLADKIINIINSHAKFRVKQLQKDLEQIEKEEWDGKFYYSFQW